MIIIDTNKLAVNDRRSQIAKLEAIAIELAIQGLNYEHVLSECNNLTYAYLNEIKAPLEFHQRLIQPLSLSEDKKVYKKVENPPQKTYEGVKLGEVFYIKEYDTYTTKLLQSKMNNSLDLFNRANGVNHFYETHRTKNELRLKRVG